MVYKFLFMLLCLGACVSEINAEEISMIKDIDENSEEDKKPLLVNKEIQPALQLNQINNEEGETKSEAAVRDFIDLQNEKLRQIKILDLELKRSDLELRQKEIQSKLIQYDHENISKSLSVNSEAAPSFFITLKGIISFQEEPQAIVMVNNQQVIVKSGGHLADHFSVVRIDRESIVLKDKSGVEKVLSVGEMI